MKFDNMHIDSIAQKLLLYSGGFPTPLHGKGGASRATLWLLCWRRDFDLVRHSQIRVRPKGSSVIMYASKQLRKHKYSVHTDWPGGIHAVAEWLSSHLESPNSTPMENDRGIWREDLSRQIQSFYQGFRCDTFDSLVQPIHSRMT